MKTFTKILLPLLGLSNIVAAQDRPWTHLTNPTAAEAATLFANPPPEYSSQFTWGVGGTATKESIDRDLDHMNALNVHAVYIGPGRGFLSPSYFNTIKLVVQEAKQRNMRVWVDDDGGYPSGFAGGKFTLERPDLRMKALDRAEQISVNAGETFSRPLDETVISALAYNQDTNVWQTLEPKNGQITWTVPAGHWTVVVPRWRFNSGPTKSANNTSGAKDTEHSLGDYLAHDAGQFFVQSAMASYQQAVGDEFGKTFLGFRGDEAAFGFNPWTPDLPVEFQKRKGYDIGPYLPAIAAIRIGVGTGRSAIAAQQVSLDPAHRAFADYCDVWSDLMGENFFNAEADWCAQNNLEFQNHIEHEEILPQMAIADGDFFKAMRHTAVPGIDAIWNQIWPGTVNDFPKLASSATHLNGRPRAMVEAFAAYNPQADIKQARWIINELMALGINHYEWMLYPSSAGRGGRAGAPAGTGGVPAAPAASTPARGPGGGGPRGFYADPGFPPLAAFANRLSYLMGEGRPAAQLGVYIPSTSFWFGDTQANTDFLKIVHGLLQNQRDLDYVDEFALASGMKLQGGEFINASGQSYRAILVPPVDAISKAALDRLHAFAQAGGKVIFFGHAPSLVMEKTFLTASGPADISWATLVKEVEVTPTVLTALPAPDVVIDHASPDLRYNHRRIQDADIYYVFNEADQPVTLQTKLATTGTGQQAQVWDGDTGKISPLPGATFANGQASLTLQLAPWEARVIVISNGPVPSNAIAASR